MCSKENGLVNHLRSGFFCVLNISLCFDVPPKYCLLSPIKFDACSLPMIFKLTIV